MKRIKIVGAIAAAGALLAACSGTGKRRRHVTETAEQGLHLSRSSPTARPATRSGTGQVRRRAGRQGLRRQGRVQLATATRRKQSTLIDGAVADKIDGIVISMANPDGLEDSVKKAVAAGIPVITINSGIDKFKDFGAITHVGQTETIAGEAVGERLKGEGLQERDLRHPGSRQRRPRGALHGGRRRRSAARWRTCRSTAPTTARSQSTITSKLQADKSIDAVLTLGGTVRDRRRRRRQGLRQQRQGRRRSTSSEDVIKDIQAGTILFAVDQQPYVQGFLGVTGLYLKSINGNDIGGGQPINSGPAFITKDNADAVLKYAAERNTLS